MEHKLEALRLFKEFTDSIYPEVVATDTVLRCVLKAIDEIIASLRLFSNWSKKQQIVYWEKVRNEVLKELTTTKQ